jgi:hypothetical protein
MPPLKTTVGQLLVNDALPPEYRDYNREILGTELNNLLGQIGRERPELYRDISHKLVQLGREASFTEGTTIRLSDLIAPASRAALLGHVRAQEVAIRKSTMTPAEKEEALTKVYNMVQQSIVDDTYQGALKSGNPLALQVLTGARGNPTQLAAMLSSPGVYTDSRGKTIPIFVQRSYAEGLSPAEYYASTFGARKGVVSTKFCLSVGTQVLMADYSVKPIEEVKVGDMVFSAFDYSMVETRVTGVSANGPKDCVRYVFSVGRDQPYTTIEIVATPDHKVMTREIFGERDGVGCAVMRPLSDLLEEVPMALELVDGTCGLFQVCYPAELVPTYDLEVDHPSHRFVLANRMIVSNSTRDAGDFGKQLTVAAADLIVTEDDCGTLNGIPVSVEDGDSVGALLARDTNGFKMGSPVEAKTLKALKQKKVDTLLVRSPITCQAKVGVCKRCVGLRENGQLPNLRDAVGISAASALAERIAQSGLNLKHSGGITSGDVATYAGFDVIDQLGQVPQSFRHRATLATADGKIERIEPAPQGGTNILINGVVHFVDAEQNPSVKVGDAVEGGDQISSGIVNPAEIVHYKGIGEGRRYFAERLTQAFRDSNLKANRRNTELIARAVIDHVEVEEPTGVGDYLPGDIVSYNGMAYSYRPRQDARSIRPTDAVGKYLEQPMLHHTIGTKLTGKMASELAGFGVDKVLVHDQEPGFVPRMERLRAVPHYGEDWVAKLQGSYLESNLLKDVHRGAVSRIHGTHPVPAIAYGVELGEQKGKEVTF